MARRTRELIDETRERTRIIPEEPALPIEEVPPTPSTPAPPTPAAPPTEPTFSLSTVDAPMLIGKVVGDSVSLNIDAEVTDVVGDVFTLRPISVTEAKPTPARRPEKLGVEGSIVRELKKPKVS